MTNNSVFWTIHTDPDRYRSFEREDRSLNWLEFLDMYKSGIQFGQNWPRIILKLFEGEDGETTKPIPDFARGIVSKSLSERARSILEPWVAKQVEFLPLITPVGLYYEMNINRVDCLDVRRSSVKRFESSGRVMEVFNYAFHWDKLQGVNIFWLPELSVSKTFVSDTFKRIVEENELTGLIFDPLPMAE